MIRCFLFLVAPACLATVAAADDWPQFLGPRRDGISRETGLLRSWPREGPPRLWGKDVGEGFSGPVVAANRLILFHRLENEEVVSCWNAASGKEDWVFKYPTAYDDPFGKGNGPRATPVISGNRVITLGAEGALSCLDLDRGTRVWSRQLLKDFRVKPSFFGVGMSPLVVGDRVLVNVGGKEAGIVAFGLKDGAELWKATSDDASYSSPVLYERDGKRLAIFLTREGVVIVDPATGNLVHQQHFRARMEASVNAATPLVLGDRVFFSASYKTGGLILQLGDKVEEVWKGEDVMDNHYNTCVAHDGHLFGFHGRQEATPSFRCVDSKTMKVKWEETGYGCGAMALAEGLLIILLESGELVLVEPRVDRYQQVARFQAFAKGPCRAQIALADGRLYARDQRRLAVWDLRRK